MGIDDPDFQLNWLRDHGHAPLPEPNARVVTHPSFYHRQDAPKYFSMIVESMQKDISVWTGLFHKNLNFKDIIEKEYKIKKGTLESEYCQYLFGSTAHHLINAQKGMPLFVISFYMSREDAKYYPKVRHASDMSYDMELFSDGISFLRHMIKDFSVSIENIPFFASRNGELNRKNDNQAFTEVAKKKGATQFEVCGSYLACVHGTREWLRQDWEETDYFRAYINKDLCFDRPDHLKSF